MPPSDNRDLYRPMTLRALRLHFVLLLGLGTIAPLTESAMFFFLLPHGMIHSSPVRYLFKFILFPTSCLWILLAINYWLQRQKPEALALQARILSYSLVASALVLSVVHTVFPSIFLLFYIAFFLTILFDDPALTRRTFFLSLAARCVGSFFSLDATLVRGEYELPNLLISIFCLAGIYLLCVGFSACLPGLSPAELISRADRALYYSKKHCRGKISVYSDIDPFLLKGYTSQNSEINCGIPENEMQKGDAESSQKAHPLG